MPTTIVLYAHYNCTACPLQLYCMPATIVPLVHYNCTICPLQLYCLSIIIVLLAHYNCTTYLPTAIVLLVHCNCTACPLQFHSVPTHCNIQVALQTRALLTRAELMEELGKMTEYLLETLGKRREEGGREEEVLIEKLRVMRARISRCSEVCVYACVCVCINMSSLQPLLLFLSIAVLLRCPHSLLPLPPKGCLPQTLPPLLP